jgi:hypothetical protein
MVRKTGLVFNALPDAEKKRTAIFANDYGEAAAIDFFGPRYGLPKKPSVTTRATGYADRETTPARR